MSADLPIQMFSLMDRFPKTTNKAGLTRHESSKARGFKRRLINLPGPLWDKLDQFAAASSRTVTQEVRQRLEASMKNQSIDEHGVIVQHVPAARK